MRIHLSGSRLNRNQNPWSRVMLACNGLISIWKVEAIQRFSHSHNYFEVLLQSRRCSVMVVPRSPSGPCVLLDPCSLSSSRWAAKYTDSVNGSDTKESRARNAAEKSLSSFCSRKELYWPKAYYVPVPRCFSSYIMLSRCSLLREDHVVCALQQRTKTWCILL
jgi:hypothetical protein